MQLNVFVIGFFLVLLFFGFVFVFVWINKKRKDSIFRRGLEFVPLLIHLPPPSDDIEKGGRDARDLSGEIISQAQVMYSIIYSIFDKSFKKKIIGQDHISLEILGKDGIIRYYAFVPRKHVEVVKQAIVSSYPTAKLEEVKIEDIFKNREGMNGVIAAELGLKKEYCYPISTYEETKRDASLALLDAMSGLKENEGLALQILVRPTKSDWIKNGTDRVKKIKEGKTNTVLRSTGSFMVDLVRAPFEVPGEHEKSAEHVQEPITNLQQEEIQAIENKTKYPAFETLIRVIASADNNVRSTILLNKVTTAFAQFDSPAYNGFSINILKNVSDVVRNYILRAFPVTTRTNILNSVELATIFHLPEQNAIPSSQVERQLTKQVDGPATLATDGVLLGTNEFRGEKKQIYLDDDNRRRHMYVIGQTGMGKSVFLENIAYQDMCDGRGFAFIDPHGDAVEALLKRVPKDRVDDVIYFDPGDVEHPVGMNMFEYSNPDQIDFIVQEGISMLQSLFDPQNQGFFGPRGQHMFRNAALLLMSDPRGATFIDIPQCFTDPEFVKSKLKFVTDKAVFDFWTKEFPASMKSNEAGDMISWFNSKWGPFIANTIMKNTLGQVKSGFNIREIMDNKKIFLVNLSKGRLGDVNANLLGMIFVMKFQQAAMSRADTPEDERQDFCLYVDEFQNFATDSFESILSEARKYRLNLIVANQFMTQLTDKIREALLGNVGTIICGRVGVTDADLMVKAFTPTFTAEDLTKTPNHAAICKVMMFGMPSAAFTMNLPAPMGNPSDELMENLKKYCALKYGKSRSEVEKEIKDRWSMIDKEKANGSPRKIKSEGVVSKENDILGLNSKTSLIGIDDKKKKVDKDVFLENWLKRKNDSSNQLNKNDGMVKNDDVKIVPNTDTNDSRMNVSNKSDEEVASNDFVVLKNDRGENKGIGNSSDVKNLKVNNDELVSLNTIKNNESSEEEQNKLIYNQASLSKNDEATSGSKNNENEVIFKIR